MSIQIRLDAAQAGMVLASALSDQQGTTLLPQGSTLSDSLLASLRQRGIDTLCVVSLSSAVETNPSDSTASTASTAGPVTPSAEAIETRLAFLFRHTDAAALPLRNALSAWRLRGDA